MGPGVEACCHGFRSLPDSGPIPGDIGFVSDLVLKGAVFEDSYGSKVVAIIVLKSLSRIRALGVCKPY